MPEPALLRVKRKATEVAPSVLVLEPRSKRAATNLHYVRKPDHNDAAQTKQETKLQQHVQSQQSQSQQTSAAEQRGEPLRRLFHLNRKRKGVDESVATFEEKRHRGEHYSDHDVESAPRSETPSPTEPLKRPSKRAAVRNTKNALGTAETDAERKRMEELATYMHQAALEEIRREKKAAEVVRSEPQPKPVATPKLSGQRSRDLHRQRIATNGSIAPSRDTEMEDDNGYVYDTYVLAPASDLGAAQVSTQSGLDNVGYLVITEEDESLWETYLEDEPSDKDWDIDEEDENAEDYYGADYPEDELASDDEFDRNAYDYRGRGASDEEEWDEDTGVYSDEDEYDGITSPFNCKTTQSGAIG